MGLPISTLLLLTCAFQATAQENGLVQRLTLVEYPLLAQQAVIQGSVELRCNIGEGGEVLRRHPALGHPLLQQSAVASAMKLRFRRPDPGALLDSEVALHFEFQLVGAPVRSRPKVEFSFEFPNRARIVSELPCTDPIPCTLKEIEAAQRPVKNKKKPILVM